MPRVLFDKNVPYSLRRHLPADQVQTVEDEGWGQISNGELVALAESAGYEVILTCDQNIQYQQNLAHRKIWMVVLGLNIWPAVKRKTTEIVDEFERASPGSFEFIDIAPVPKRRRLERLG